MSMSPRKTPQHQPEPEDDDTTTTTAANHHRLSSHQHLQQAHNSTPFSVSDILSPLDVSTVQQFPHFGAADDCVSAGAGFGGLVMNSHYGMQLGSQGFPGSQYGVGQPDLTSHYADPVRQSAAAAAAAGWYSTAPDPRFASEYASGTEV